MDPVSIIYENKEILVINKPFGVSVQGGSGVSHPLDEELSKQVGYKIYLVHRLDRETSGLMIVAKSPQSASKWISLIGSKKVHKEYTAICFGIPVVKQKDVLAGVISMPVNKDGRVLEAVTHFEVKKTVVLAESNIEGDNESIVRLSIIKLVLGTGRMHQIRIHLGKCMCPIVADDKHGNFKLNKKVQKLCKIKKLCLASTKIVIPIEGKDVAFEIPLPQHMAKVYEEYFVN